MAILTTEAVVLRTIDYSETSLIVWLYTRDHGRVHLIAKGARRPRSPFEGALEPLVLGRVSFYRKARPDGLEVAKEFDPLDLHLGLRRDLGRLYRGLYVGELLRELSEHELPPGDAFPAAREALAELARGEAAQLDTHLIRCELRLLAAAGWAPNLEACAPCGRPLDASGPGWFSPAAGGAVCREHAGPPPGCLSASRGALRTLRAISQGTAVTVGRELSRELRGLLDAFVTWHLERPLRLPRLLRGLATPAA